VNSFDANQPTNSNIGGRFGAVLLGKRMDIGLLILGLRLGCLNLRAVYELNASLAPFIPTFDSWIKVGVSESPRCLRT
jgi:hypothetical protein